MKHAVKTRRFGKTESHRNMMFRNLVTSLIKHGRVETTLAKAKELRSWGDKMITLGKRGDLHARRQALAVITEKEVVKKLFDEIAPLYQDRQGGYTRIVKLGHRTGDAAPMAVIELVGKREAEKKAEKKAEKTRKKKKKEE
ncbi:MAG: 50S ribosomal protein L17 [bacterium]